MCDWMLATTSALDCMSISPAQSSGKPSRNFCGRFTRGTFILKLRNKVKDLYSTSVQLKEVKL